MANPSQDANDYYSLKQSFQNIKKDFNLFVKKINVNGLKEKINELESKLSSENVWRDSNEARKVNKDYNRTKELLNNILDIDKRLKDLETLFEEGDEGLFSLLYEEYKQIQSLFNKLKLVYILNGEYDKKHAILSITSGAGGTDAQDWAEMLFRMYMRFLDIQNWKYDVLNIQKGEEAGIKNATLLVKEDYAYGYLKAENGVHRLVRISPFDANKRRHTSFASVLVLPDLGDDVDVDISMDDLKIETFRAGGAGGQHVNTTDSAVRITHIPTGIVVQCQNERSQHKNKELALKILKSRLYQLELEKKKSQKEKLADKKKIEWGRQIRSYVLHPYKMVKDHRTGYEVPSVEKVLDGDIFDFIERFLFFADD